MLVDFGSFHSRVDNVINDSFNYTVTRHRWNCQELTVALLRLVARLFMFLLIFNEQLYFDSAHNKKELMLYCFIMCRIKIKFSYSYSYNNNVSWRVPKFTFGFVLTGHTKKRPGQPGALEYCLNRIFVEIIIYNCFK